MRKFITLISTLLICGAAVCDTVGQRAEAYIGQYSSIAVSEMLRSGVPASITLAQGLLESSYGQSYLAVQGNNHFGIKCHSDWQGEHVFFDDDKPHECFRKYPSAEQSFTDHSDFLRYKPRYAFLFEYKTDDYSSWAYGLKKAGYATDPSYAAKLIKLIETYNLSRFDRLPVQESGQEVTLPESPAQLEQPVRAVATGKTGFFAVSLEREVLSLNGVPFVYARNGETYRSIAQSYDLFPKELASFNESKDPDRRLDAGQVVYLQHKADRAAKGLDKHICSEGETLSGISQRYAVRMKSLMKLNHIKEKYHVFREDDTVLLR